MAAPAQVIGPGRTRFDDGGYSIRGGRVGDDARHYGGTVVDAEGMVLATYADDEVNPGTPRPEVKAETPRGK